MCPAVTLHKWKKDWHSIQKYHNFIYQIAFVGSCSGIHISQVSLSAKRISIFNLLVFLFWLPLAVPIVQRTLHHCKYDLSWEVRRFGWTFFFHITKLLFCSQIFKFKFLFLNSLQKQLYFLLSVTSLVHYLRLQNCFFSALLWLEVQGETIREE